MRMSSYCAYEFILNFYERLSWVKFTNMGLSSYIFNFKVRPSNDGDFTWNAEPLCYLLLLGPNFMNYL